MAYTGRFIPKNPQKYVGDPSNIIWRSTWECKLMTWFDTNPDVIRWASEEITIPYISPVDGRPHRYFPDFVVSVKSRTGGTKTLVVEVKPYKQTLPPEPRKRKTKQFLNEVMTFGVNDAKWKAAREYCAERKWEFRIITEKDLFGV